MTSNTISVTGHWRILSYTYSNCQANNGYGNSLLSRMPSHTWPCTPACRSRWGLCARPACRASTQSRRLLQISSEGSNGFIMCKSAGSPPSSQMETGCPYELSLCLSVRWSFACSWKKIFFVWYRLVGSSLQISSQGSHPFHRHFSQNFLSRRSFLNMFHW